MKGYKISSIEIYDEYKHLDHLLSDKGWLGEDFRSKILYDLWNWLKLSVNDEVSKSRKVNK